MKIMQWNIKKRIGLMIASSLVFLAMNSVNNINGVNGTAAAFEEKANTDMQKSFDKESEEENKLQLSYQADWENNRIKIYWTPVQNASRYRVYCKHFEDPKSITLLEQDISAQEEMAFTHEFEYGKKYICG